MNVGQGLPPAQRRTWAEQQLTPGRILYVHYPLTYETKDKYIVIADDDDWPRVLVVNSNRRENVERHPDLTGRQLLLKPSDYSFLDHDSYLNCTEVLQGLTKEDIVSQLVADVNRAVGELLDSTRAEVMAAVCGARTVATTDQSAILTALRQ